MALGEVLWLPNLTLKTQPKQLQVCLPLDIAVRACIIKLITAVIYSFHNKLECFSLNTRLGWKDLPGTNTLANYGNRKLRW